MGGLHGRAALDTNAKVASPSLPANPATVGPDLASKRYSATSGSLKSANGDFLSIIFLLLGVFF
jgi:hypothetical protein